MGHLMTFWILVCSMLIVTPIVTEGNTVGVTYGRMSSQILLPSVVSEMLMANGVKRVKLFSFYRGVVPAFSNTGVEMMITIPTLELTQINEPDKADAYAVINMTRAYKQYDLNVQYFMVGNEPYTIVDNYTSLYQNQFHLGLEYISKSIKKQPEPYNQIKASIPHAMDVLIPKILKPSDADFNDNIKERMLSVLKTLEANEAPFVVNIYPHLTLVEKGYPLEFGFFDNVDSGFKIIDGPRVYTNVFDFVYDSFVWALKKHGYDKMEVIVSQVGWPTDGHFYANISTAQRFYNGFLKKIAKDEGTPLRPGPINVYLNNINDENNRDMTFRGPTVRHYGIYDYKGQPKFQLDFSLKGRKDVELVSANGVVSMPRRWCVYDNSTMGKNSTQQVMEQFEYACSKADCSKLFYGSSYNNFTFEGNVSYAFNNYFQSKNQAENECDFKGLGKIQQEDPSSQYGGNFPLQFLSTTFGWGKTEMGLTLAQKGTNAIVSGAAGRVGTMAYGLTVLVPLLSLFFLGIFV